jgi:hypothetical protein
MLSFLDPEVLLCDSLVILKRESGSFGTFSSECTQEKVWSDGGKHLLDSEIGKREKGFKRSLKLKVS